MPRLPRRKSRLKRAGLAEDPVKISLRKLVATTDLTAFVDGEKRKESVNNVLEVSVDQITDSNPLSKNHRISSRLAQKRANDSNDNKNKSQDTKLCSNTTDDKDSLKSPDLVNRFNRRTWRKLACSVNGLHKCLPFKKYNPKSQRAEHLYASQIQGKPLSAEACKRLVTFSQVPEPPAYKKMTNTMLIRLLDIYVEQKYPKLDPRIVRIVKEVKALPECILVQDFTKAIRAFKEEQGNDFIGLDEQVQNSTLRSIIKSVYHVCIPSQSAKIGKLLGLLQQAGCNIRQSCLISQNSASINLLPKAINGNEKFYVKDIDICFENNGLDVSRHNELMLGVLKLFNGEIALIQGIPDFVGYSVNNTLHQHPDVVVEVKNHAITTDFHARDAAQCLAYTIMLAALHQKGGELASQPTYGYLVGTNNAILEITIKRSRVGLTFVDWATGEMGMLGNIALKK